MKQWKKRLACLLALGCLSGVGCTTGGGNSVSDSAPQNSVSSGEQTSEEEEKRTMTNGPIYDGVALSAELWQAPDYFESPEDDRTEEGANIKALYYRTVYKNEETYAFAYLGIPNGVSATNKAPAVLLLHGGAGSAYWEWVKAWNNRGYVALAMDLEGHVPTKDGTLTSAWTDLYTKSKFPAPSNHNYDDSRLPLEETWMYYAVQTAIAGNSLLHGLDCVDTYKIGVCGVSWGSVITSIVTGYDDRFAFSIPIYGTVGLQGTPYGLATYYEKNPDALIWDDTEGLRRSETPMYFICGNTDAHFSADAVGKTAAACKNAEVVIIKDFLHSQFHATMQMEAYAFADEIVKKKQTLVRFEKQPAGREGTVTVRLPDGNGIEKAYVVYTEGDMTQVETWRKDKCQVEGNVISYLVPSEAKNYYIQVEDAFGYYASSTIVNVG